MRVYAAKSPKALGRRAGSSEVRHLDLLRVADHHILNLSFAIDQNADLAPRLERDLRHLSRELLGDDLCGWYAPSGEPFDTAKLVVLEALCKPRNVANRN